MAGGGRYNALIEQIGGKSIPGMGFAGGFERLIMALEEEKIPLGTRPRPFIWLICLGDRARLGALSLLNELRGKGLYVEYDPDKVSLKAQFKAADNAGAKYAMIIGDDEIETNQLNLKNLESGEQRLISLDAAEIMNAVKNM